MVHEHGAKRGQGEHDVETSAKQGVLSNRVYNKEELGRENSPLPGSLRLARYGRRAGLPGPHDLVAQGLFLELAFSLLELVRVTHRLRR